MDLNAIKTDTKLMKIYLLLSFIVTGVCLLPMVSTWWALPILFFTWYVGIVFEHATRLEKTVPALLAGFLMWVKLKFTGDAGEHAANHALEHVSQVLVFIICAMTIVEMILMHNGFHKVKKYVSQSGSMKKLYLSVIILTGIFTMIIDNLTATIFMGGFALAMINILENKRWFIAAIVLVANIMGACSVLGDLTTTMAWIRDLIEPGATFMFLFIPCLISSSIAAYLIYQKLQDERIESYDDAKDGDEVILYVGLASFVMIPILKAILHMEPWQIIPFSLALVWIVSELRHPEQNFFDTGREGKNAFHALGKIEMTAVLFFLGILFAVSSMTTVGQIKTLCVSSLAFAQSLSPVYGFDIISLLIGKLSAIIDNVPMMQAAMDGFDNFAQYAYEWYSLAYTCGSGGNLLIIGSAAGVIAMTMVKGLSFGWWFKNVTKIALLVYLVGYGVILLMKPLFF
jgi:Na+/H+ antiporter NhaD/arsenite permease-like protein